MIRFHRADPMAVLPVASRGMIGNGRVGTAPTSVRVLSGLFRAQTPSVSRKSFFKHLRAGEGLHPNQIIIVVVRVELFH